MVEERGRACRVVSCVNYSPVRPYFLNLSFGNFNVFLAVALFFGVVLALAIWRHRHKGRLRRQKGVAERVR